MMRLLFEFYLSTDIDNIKEQIRSDCPKTTFTGEQRVTVSVYDYTQIIFAAGLGFLLFAQIPDWLSILGYCIIIAMAVVMFFYNKESDK